MFGFAEEGRRWERGGKETGINGLEGIGGDSNVVGT
jgi:hypothetical protein